MNTGVFLLIALGAMFVVASAVARLIAEARRTPEQLDLIRNLLRASRGGLYGADIARMSGGVIGHGEAHWLLDRLADYGEVVEIVDSPSCSGEMPRVRYALAGLQGAQA